MLLILLMLKGSKVYSLYSGPSLLQEGRPVQPSVLWIYQFTTSQSEEAALLSFLDLSTTWVIAGKMHSQSILKTKQALSNPVILRYLQTKLQPPYPNQTTCLVYKFRCLKNVGLYISFGGGRFSFRQSWLT